MKKTILIVIAIVLVTTHTSIVNAATTSSSKLSQVIGAGVLSTSINDAGGAVVSNPSFSLSSVNVSTATQTTTGTFGTSSQRITVDNPGGANNGWTLALAATDGASATWSNGSNTYLFNGTTTTGQLTLNPAIATLTPSGSYTATGITKGIQATFSAATPITLLTAASTSDDIWNGYLTGVGVSQIIPASQPTGSYTIDLTQTVTAS